MKNIIMLLKKEIEKYSTEHLKSVTKHIDDLSNKHYSNLKGLNSPDLYLCLSPLKMHTDFS